jgi:hypothetical protein
MIVERPFFALTEADADGTRTVVILIPNSYLRAMKAGQGVDVDLTKVGVPFKVIVGRCIDQADGMRILAMGSNENTKNVSDTDLGIPGVPRA